MMNAARSKIVGYARSASLPELGGDEEIRHQLQSIEDHAERIGVDLVEVIGEPADSGVSFGRPGLSRLVEMLSDGSADGVMVYDLGRLSREQSDFFTLYRKFFGSRGGRRLISVTDYFDTDAFTAEIDDIVWHLASVGIDEIADEDQVPDGCLPNAVRRMKYLGVECAAVFKPFDETTEDLVIINLDNGGGRPDDLVPVGISLEEANDLFIQLSDLIGDDDDEDVSDG